MDIHNILIGGRKFWSQICGQETFRTPNTDHPRSISSVIGLVRQLLLWNQHQVELPKTGCRLIHARVYTSGTTQVSTQSTNTKITCTTFLGTTLLWNNPTILQGRLHIQKNTPKLILRLQKITATLLFYANVDICPVALPFFMSRFFGSDNDVDSHKRSMQYELSLETFWITQCGCLRLCITVAMGGNSTN